MFGYIKGKIALDKVQQARKNFKIIATEERPEHSLSLIAETKNWGAFKSKHGGRFQAVCVC